MNREVIDTPAVPPPATARTGEGEAAAPRANEHLKGADVPLVQQGVSLTGSGEVGGLAVGAAVIFEHVRIRPTTQNVDPAGVDGEVHRLDQAMVDLRKHYDQFFKGKAGNVPNFENVFVETLIFIKPDSSGYQKIKELITKSYYTAEAAIYSYFDTMCEEAAVLRRSLASFSVQFASSTESSREAEFAELSNQLLHLLSDRPADSDCLVAALDAKPGNKILICKTLSPAQITRLEGLGVTGVIIDDFGHFSHIKQLLKEYRIPSVSKVRDREAAAIRCDDVIILDGEFGKIVVRPLPQDIAEAEKAIAKQNVHHTPIPISKAAPRTRDHVMINVTADLTDLAHSRTFLDQHVLRVGLVRTEYMVLKTNTFIGYDDQVAAYTKLLQDFSPKPVTIRLMDLGGEKTSGGLGVPGVGVTTLRGIRFAKKYCEQELITQFKAIIKSAVDVDTDVTILVPMVFDAGDMIYSREIYKRSVELLIAEGRITEQPTNIELHAMLETPSALLEADKIFAECDGASVGTRDLVDALSAGGTDSPAFYHSAFLRAATIFMEAARRAGKPIAFCGEMPRNEVNVPLLLGLGVRSFSVARDGVAKVNAEIRLCGTKQCERLVEALMATKSGREAKVIFDGFRESMTTP